MFPTPLKSALALHSGQAALTFTPAEDGLYRATYTVNNRPVFTTGSFCGGDFEFLIESVMPDELNGAILHLAGHWQSAGQTGPWQGKAKAFLDQPGWFRLKANFELAEPLLLEKAIQAPALALRLTASRE